MPDTIRRITREDFDGGYATTVLDAGREHLAVERFVEPGDFNPQVVGPIPGGERGYRDRIVVVTDADGAVGTVLLDVRRNDAGELVGTVDELLVRSDRQGAGRASLLLSDIVARAQSYGCAHIIAHAITTAGKAALESAGFAVTVDHGDGEFTLEHA